MARFNRSPRQALPSSLKRKTTWSLGPVGQIAKTGTGPLLIPTGAQSLLAAQTLIRTRGEVLLFLSSVDASLTGMSGAVGICIVSENAFNAGIGSIPDPTADIAWDGWLWYSIFNVFASGATIATDTGPVHQRLLIDSKAMRKIKQTDVVCAVVGVDSEVGTAVMQVKLNTRLLSKLA